MAHDIAKVLGANTRRQGYDEGNGYQVTWTYGHLCMLKEPHDYFSQWKAWSLAALPMVPPRFGIKLIDDEGIRKQFGIIEGLMQKADMIINCGDAGQEGELIQRWVMQKAAATCPVKRLWISSLTEEAIREGFDTLHEASDYQRLYEAGLCRALGDWLLGMNATRLYTLKYAQNRQVLSIGRVQTPTLALIVKRYEEITNFVPEQYWELKTTYRDTVFNATKGRLKSQEEGLQLIEAIQSEPFIVTDVAKKDGREAPPRLLDLTSLQVECNKKFGFSADTTLKLIQSLYEKKFTTYPRVDTTFLPDDVYPKCHTILNGLTDYQPLLAPLRGKPLRKSKKVFDNSKVTDHHAIIPTGINPTGLSDMEKRVFDLVARRFLAVFFPDCLFATTTVLGKAGDIEFKTSGKTILDPGWRAVLDDPKDSKENKDSKDLKDVKDFNDLKDLKDAKDSDAAPERTLPLFTKGESGPHTPELQEKWTQPPKPYTEASLLRAMETAGKTVEDEELRDALKENGIGRPSTRAAIIETLFKRNYIVRERKALQPTQTGVELIHLIHEEVLKSAELTGIWEKHLRDIEKGSYEPHQFLDELKQMLCGIVSQVLNDATNRRIN